MRISLKILPVCLALFSADHALAQSCQTWRNRSPQIFSRSYAKMVYDSRREVSVLYGGAHGAYRGFDTETWEWNGTDWTLRSTWGPPARTNHAMAYDNLRGVTVLFGGRSSGDGDELNDTWEWDGNKWAELSPPIRPSPRTGHTMAFDSARGVAVLFGGRDSSDYMSETWEWNGTTWVKRTPANSPPARGWFAMVYDSARGVTVLFGGTNFSGVLGDTWEWDGTNWTNAAPSGPPPQSRNEMAYDSARGATVLFSAEYAPNTPSVTWTWDGVAWTQQAVGGPPRRNNYMMAFDAHRGVAVLFGGTSDGDLWEWDGISWTMRLGGTLALLPPAGDGSAMAYDSQRQVSVLLSKSSTDSETWEWDSESWTRRAVGGPAARTGHAMSFDSVRGMTIVFGGYGTDYLGDTWEWDGSSWDLRATTGPSPRKDARMAFDGARGVAVLFGGYADDELGDTWEWDGSVWTQRAISGPSARFAHAMAFDDHRGVTVLFGGGVDFSLGISGLGGTWEWNGNNWTQRTVPEPPSRYGHTLVYDPARQVSVLYGGANIGPSDGTVPKSDTSEWDGSMWRQQDSARPAARYGHAAAFDEARGVAVVFGGNGFPETWEYPCSAGCPLVASAPVAEGYAPCTGCYARKNRYISFAAPSLLTGASSMALRVTFGPSPDPTTCHGSPDRRAHDGVEMWVGAELLVGAGIPTGLYQLQPVPLFRDWSTVPSGIIQIADCNIVPCAAYTVRALTDVACDPWVFGGFSPAAVLPTTLVWGDVVGANELAPANGIVNITDIAAVVDCFREVQGAPPRTWCDLGGDRPSQGVNLTPNIADVVLVVDAFRGFAYPFPGPTAPAACAGIP